MAHRLKNISIRIVGTYLRVNIPVKPGGTPPARYKPSIDLPELVDVEDGPNGYPTVGTVMDALSRALPGAGYDLTLSDIPATGLLDIVRFGPTGCEEPFRLSAAETTAALSGCAPYCPSGRSMVATWQYCLSEYQGGPAVAIAGRRSYHDSPEVRDGMSIVWRLTITHASAMSVTMKARRRAAMLTERGAA